MNKVNQDRCLWLRKWVGAFAAFLVVPSWACRGPEDGRARPADVGIKQSALKPIGANVLVDFTSRSADKPWHMIGAMSGLFNHGEDGVATCVKALNNYTCITAAHTFFNCNGPVDKRGWVQPPVIRFMAGRNIDHVPVILAGTYGVAAPRAYWAGCRTNNFDLKRDNDIAVIRFRGAFDTAANQADTVHFGDPNPTVPLAYYDVGFVPPNSMGLPPGDFGRYNVTLAGYPHLATLPADYRPQNVVFGPYPALTIGEGYGFLRSATPSMIEYTATSWGAMSGGPVFDYPDDCEDCALNGYRLIAIHIGRPVVNGVEVLAPPITHNRGVLLTDHMVDYLWRLAGR
jgi:hypothetical protein